jgi:phage tail sheath protein FI
MAAFQRPGVYVQETLNPVPTALGPNSDSIGAFVGANDRGPVTPVLVTSWSQYASLFGTWNSNADNSLPLSIYMFFANGGSQAYVCRTVGAGSVIATRVFTDRAGTPLSTLNLKAINAGTWGNSINISIDDSLITGYITITVYYGGSTDAFIVERFTDVTMVSTDARYAPSVINSQSLYITATDLVSASSGTTKNPSVVANQALATGANGSTPNTAAYTSTFSTFDVIKQSLVLNVPGQTTAAIVNAAITYATGRADVFVVVDGVNDTVANQLTLAASYTATSYAAVYYPQITIADPTLGVGGATGATKTLGAGAAVTGLFMATDASRGVFKAPAGLSARLGGAVSVATLTSSELDSLNSASAAVNAIKFVPGTGIVVMGSRTLKSGYVDKYVPVRRTLIYLTKSLKDLTEFAVFEPNDEALWRRLSATCNGFLTQFWAQGGLRGTTPNQAFFVKVDATNNTQVNIDNGEVRIEVGVALQRPAEFVIIKIGQFDGGSTVTVA